MSKRQTPASDLSPQYPLLGFLYLQPMHGYELHQRLEAELHETWRISQSQAYSILQRLESAGLIAAAAAPRSRRADPAAFALTDLGRAEFESWLHTPTRSSARAIRVEFLTRLFFACQLCAKLCRRIVRAQVTATRLDLATMQRQLDGIALDQVFNRLGLELRVRQVSALLEWLESFDPSRLHPGAT